MMADQRIPLSVLFGAVAQSMAENQAYLNSLDDKNGNAGDNYVHNWQVVQRAVTQAEQRDADSGTAMMVAARALQRQGQGRTAQMYSAGLARAATQFAGQNGISLTDFLPLLEGLLGGMQGTTNRRPGEGSPMDALLPGILGYLAAKQQGADDQQALMAALGQAMGMTGVAGSRGQRGYAAPQPGGGLGDLLGSLLGGGMAAPTPQPQAPAGGGADLLGSLLQQLLGGGGLTETPAPAPAPQTPAPAPQTPRQRSTPRQAPPPEQNPNLGLEELLKGLLAGPQGGSPLPDQTPSAPAPQTPYGRDYQPPAQPDPGAAGGTALLEGLLRGLLGGQSGGEGQPAPAPSRPASPTSPRIGRRGEVSEA